MNKLNDNYRKEFQLVLSLIQDKNFSEARELVEELIAKNPERKQLQMVYGDCLLGLGELQQARKCFVGCLSERKLRSFCYIKIARINEKLEEFSEALIFYRKASELDPKNSSLLNSIGNIHKRNRSYIDAINSYDQALSIQPNNLVAKTNKGLVKHILGEYAESVELFMQVLETDENNLRVLKLLADAYINSQDLKKAFFILEKAIKLAPNELSIIIKIAEVSKELGNFKLAINFLEDSIKENQAHASLYIALSGIYRETEDFRLYIETSEKALKLDPNSEVTINNYGVALTEIGEYSKAISFYKKAAKSNPQSYEIITNLGMAYALMGEYSRAIPALEKAIKINKKYSKAHFGLAKAYLEIDCYAKSIESFQTAYKLNPLDLNSAKWMAYPLMYLYKFRDAWRQYENRWTEVDRGGRLRESSWPLPKTKVWSGEKCDRLTLWREQGLGDEFLFLGLIPEAQELAKKLTIYSDKRLIPLYKRSFPEISIKAYEKPIMDKKFNYHAPIGGLASIFRQSEEDFERTKKGYLKADSERVAAIRAELGLEGKKVIGISWKSFNGSNMDNKNMPLNFFYKIFEGLDVTLVNLQYGDVDKEIRDFEGETGIKIIQCGSVDNREDLDGLAALIEMCDLVVSTSNVTIHLAGALGKDGFVLLSFIHGFWWLRDRNDSVWYPSIKIYRQKKFQDWHSIPGSLRSALIEKFGVTDECISKG